MPFVSCVGCRRQGVEEGGQSFVSSSTVRGHGGSAPLSKSQCWHKSLDFGGQRFGRLREVLQVRCAAARQWQKLTQPGHPSCSAECGAASRRKCGMVVRDL